MVPDLKILWVCLLDCNLSNSPTSINGHL